MENLKENSNSEFRLSSRGTTTHIRSYSRPNIGSVESKMMNNKVKSGFSISDFYLTNIEKKMNNTGSNFFSKNLHSNNTASRTNNNSRDNLRNLHAKTSSYFYKENKDDKKNNLFRKQNVAQIYFKQSLGKSQSVNNFDSAESINPHIFDESAPLKPSYGNYIQTLPVELRKVYGESKPMKKLFEDFDISYGIFEEICTRVKIYKSE